MSQDDSIDIGNEDTYLQSLLNSGYYDVELIARYSDEGDFRITSLSEPISCQLASLIKLPQSFIHPSNELDSDIHGLFQNYNETLFNGTLFYCVVGWSERMTLCAGTCTNKVTEQHVKISLSRPLLQYRSAREIKQTLLHEMIHAYLFIYHPKACRQDGHGREFQLIMQAINHLTGFNITVRHSFHDQVRAYKTHVWRCNGQCNQRPPYYGFVRRAMNRKPGPSDFWWRRHQSGCSGQFVKIEGPEPKKSKDIKSKDIKSKNIKSKDMKSKDMKSKERSKDKSISTDKIDKARSKGKRGQRSNIWANRTPIDKKNKWGVGKKLEDYLKEMQDEQEKKTEGDKQNERQLN